MSVFQGKRAAAAAAITAATALALAPQALAASFEVNFDCAGDSPLGQQEFSLQQSTEVTAPETVAPGGDLEIVTDPAPNTVPAEVDLVLPDWTVNLGRTMPCVVGMYSPVAWR